MSEDRDFDIIEEGTESEEVIEESEVVTDETTEENLQEADAVPAEDVTESFEETEMTEGEAEEEESFEESENPEPMDGKRGVSEFERELENYLPTADNTTKVKQPLPS